MSMMIMFGDETFDGFSVRTQHNTTLRTTRAGAITTLIAVLWSYEHF